jgi:hypothetical protein
VRHPQILRECGPRSGAVPLRQVGSDGARAEADVQAFKEGGYDRKGFDLKDIRMLIVGDVLASNKPWEVLVGQTLGQLLIEVPVDCSAEGSILNYVGAKGVENLLSGLNV